MASFNLPKLSDNPSGSWGPSSSNFPESFKFKDIPYAPYSKSDKLSRFADWNELSLGGDGRGGAGGAGASGASGPRGAQGGRTGGRRDGAGQAAFGSGSASAFASFQIEDESNFSVVDNRSVPARRPGQARAGGKAPSARLGGASAGGYGGRGGGARGRGGGYGGGRGGARGGGRRGWRDWDKSGRSRESSVAISPEWQMLDEVEFIRLAKARLEVDEPEDIDTYGKLAAYDKTFDRITTKTERPLALIDRIKYNTTTSDDPVIQQLSSKNVATIFTTDAILSVLMTAPRSVYSWDIVIVRDGDKLFLDKRDGGPFDTLTVNENASDPPQDPAPPNPNDPKAAAAAQEAPSINSATSLSLEATYINQNFHFMSVREDESVSLAHPNPFYGPDESEPLASCGYRYRVFDLGLHEGDETRVCVRTEVDAFLSGSNAQSGKGLVTIRALNEFDPRAQGAGGASDWRTKLDSQRGAVVATEMKNNSCKLAKWTVQSILAGAELMKLGWVSRASPRDNTRHVVLSTTSVRPADFAAQLNVSIPNGWGIVRAVIDLAMKQPDGKYVLVKDPNKPVMRLYAVPMSAFTADDDEDVDEGLIEEGDE